MIDQATLGSVPLFDGLSNEARGRLTARAVRRRFRRGEVLWRAGEPSRGLWLLLEGAVDVVHPRGTQGRLDLVHREGPGGSMGEIPLLTGVRMPATAVARRAGECVILHGDDVGVAVRMHPALALRMMARLAGRVHTLVTRLDRLRGSTVMNRLAAHLVAGHDRAGGRPFRLAARQAEVAQDLGTAREVIVRYLGKLRRSGVIRAAGRGRWQVVDRGRLAAMASPGVESSS